MKRNVLVAVLLSGVFLVLSVAYADPLEVNNQGTFCTGCTQAQAEPLALADLDWYAEYHANKYCESFELTLDSWYYNWVGDVFYVEYYGNWWVQAEIEISCS